MVSVICYYHVQSILYSYGEQLIIVGIEMGGKWISISEQDCECIKVDQLDSHWVTVRIQLNMCSTRHVTRFSTRWKSTTEIKTKIYILGTSMTVENLHGKSIQTGFWGHLFYNTISTNAFIFHMLAQCIKDDNLFLKYTRE